MAIGADELPFHDWQVVDPASMAYIRHLVESLEHLTFDDACMLQLDGGENASDLFNLHRPVITGVPHDVASALNTLEEILSRGSPTLEAYQREDIRETRVLQEEKVRTTMAEVRYIDGLVDEHMDAVEGTRARLHAARDTKQQLLEKITAAAADGDVASLELELSEAEESEAALLAEFMNQWQSVAQCSPCTSTVGSPRADSKTRWWPSWPSHSCLVTPKINTSLEMRRSATRTVFSCSTSFWTCNTNVNL